MMFQRTNIFRMIVAGLAFSLSTFAAYSDGHDSAWPQFQGPFGTGLATESNDVPVTWSETENIAWKIPIPHRGWSSPVIEGNQIWLTTATENGNDFFVIGVDAKTGNIFYHEKIFHSDNPEPLGNNVNGYASPSSVIESGRLYVHFGSYGTACIDTETFEVLWRRDDLPCRHFRGPGSSAIVFEDLLILTFDGVDQQYVTALNRHSGKTVWRTDRSTAWNDLDENGLPKRDGDFRKAFSTPLIVDVNGNPLLLSVSSYSIFGYEPSTGREIWNIRIAGYTPSTRPAIWNNLAFTATGFRGAGLSAIRLDGKGDVTDTHVEWNLQGKQVPDTPSPIVVDDLLYTVSDRGIVTCTEPATGEEVWNGRIGGNHNASPIYAGGRLYFFSVQGETTVLQAGREFKVLAANVLESGFMASPAVSGNALIVRSKEALYRIEAAD